MEYVCDYVNEGLPADVIYLDFKMPLTECHTKNCYINFMPMELVPNNWHGLKSG